MSTIDIYNGFMSTPMISCSGDGFEFKRELSIEELLQLINKAQNVLPGALKAKKYWDSVAEAVAKSKDGTS